MPRSVLHQRYILWQAWGKRSGSTLGEWCMQRSRRKPRRWWYRLKLVFGGLPIRKTSYQIHTNIPSCQRFHSIEMYSVHDQTFSWISDLHGTRPKSAEQSFRPKFQEVLQIISHSSIGALKPCLALLPFHRPLSHWFTYHSVEYTVLVSSILTSESELAVQAPFQIAREIEKSCVPDPTPLMSWDDTPFDIFRMYMLSREDPTHYLT